MSKNLNSLKKKIFMTTLYISIYEKEWRILYIDWFKYKTLKTHQFKTSMWVKYFEKNDINYKKTIKYKLMYLFM